jgi:dihydroorotate dehydrogenase
VYQWLYDTVFARIDPERIHDWALNLIAAAGHVPGLRRLIWEVVADPRLGARPVTERPDGWTEFYGDYAGTELFGRRLTSPLGVAAGFDKDARAIAGLTMLGFGFVEVGTVTARAQPGNPKPRLWRLTAERALRNRMGFNNPGARAIARRLAWVRRTPAGRAAIVGVNIGKSKVTPADRAAIDYGTSARLLAPYADYLVVNVSSPNTPGLRDLQAVEKLRPILEAARAGADRATLRGGTADVGPSPSGTGVADGGAHPGRPGRSACAALGAVAGVQPGDEPPVWPRSGRVPLLVKIAPDLADEDVLAVADLAGELGLDGIVAANTSIKHDLGEGGLSGPPLKDRALDVVRLVRGRLAPGKVVIGVGGIASPADVAAFLHAGADAVQAYTAFIYRGPFWPGRIARAFH